MQVTLRFEVDTEIAKTDLVDLVLKAEWIKIRTVQPLDFIDLNDNEINNLGGGEKECMALCKTFSKHIIENSHLKWTPFSIERRFNLPMIVLKLNIILIYQNYTLFRSR